jgi:hypothetical protein
LEPNPIWNFNREIRAVNAELGEAVVKTNSFFVPTIVPAARAFQTGRTDIAR